MMTMAIKKKVVYNDKIQCFDIYDENDELIACIDSYNFYEFRKNILINKQSCYITTVDISI